MAPRKKADDDDTDGSDGTDVGDGAGGSAGSAGSDDGAGGGDGGDTGDDDLESHLRKLVTEVVGKVLGDRPAGGAGTTQAQDEASIRRMVREAQEALHKEEEKDSRFKEVAETVDQLKKVVEKAPARAGLGGRLQRVMWGSEE